MSWWTNIWLSRSSQWCYGLIDDLASHDLEPNRHYLSVTLRSIHLPYVRKGLTRFFGAVHCFSKLAHDRDGEQEFHAFTVPTGLKGVSAAGLHNVVNARKSLLGPVPYRGGGVALEMALFSIASQDLAEPFLSVLEGLSDAIGVSYIGAATTLLRQLSNGIENISKSPDGSTLEIGVSTDLGELRTGSYVVLREQRDVRSLALDSSGRLTDKNGTLVTEAYFVFDVESSTKRDDWRRIPALLEAYKRLEEPVRVGRLPEVDALLLAFKRTVLLSPDLLQVDADRIATEVQKRITDVMQATHTRKTSSTLPPLDSISIDSN